MLRLANVLSNGAINILTVEKKLACACLFSSSNDLCRLSCPPASRCKSDSRLVDSLICSGGRYKVKGRTDEKKEDESEPKAGKTGWSLSLACVDISRSTENPHPTRLNRNSANRNVSLVWSHGTRRRDSRQRFSTRVDEKAGLGLMMNNSRTFIKGLCKGSTRLLFQLLGAHTLRHHTLISLPSVAYPHTPTNSKAGLTGLSFRRHHYSSISHFIARLVLFRCLPKSGFRCVQSPSQTLA